MVEFKKKRFEEKIEEVVHTLLNSSRSGEEVVEITGLSLENIMALI